MDLDWLRIGIALGTAVVVALVVIAAVTLLTRVLLRRHEWPRELIDHVRRPFRTLLIVIALWFAAQVSLPQDADWWDAVHEVLVIAALVSGGWFLVSLITFVTGQMLGRYRVDVPDNAEARRIQTQGLILQRLAIAVVVIMTVGAILMTFPAVRAVGASVLASAGIASIVAGLAAQSTLANMFAGIQLVFSRALRVDDVVVAGGEWGRVGEITLSYVVLNVWDQRRLILPCTYFTSQPFESWTRKSAEILGTVYLDVDWRVPMTELRSKFLEFVAASELWDQRKAGMIVTDATGGYVTVRCTVSAKDSDDVWTLRCQVREELVAWIQKNHPEALPVTRVQVPAAITST